MMWFWYGLTRPPALASAAATSTSEPTTCDTTACENVELNKICYLLAYKQKPERWSDEP